MATLNARQSSSEVKWHGSNLQGKEKQFKLTMYHFILSVIYPSKCNILPINHSFSQLYDWSLASITTHYIAVIFSE